MEKAVYWYLRGAEAGNDVCMLELGFAYEWGAGLSQDLDKAVAWYQKSIAQGNKVAMIRMENICERREEYEEAAKWYEKAAAAGNEMAMFNLAELYANGKGVAKDMNAA